MDSIHDGSGNHKVDSTPNPKTWIGGGTLKGSKSTKRTFNPYYNYRIPLKFLTYTIIPSNVLLGGRIPEVYFQNYWQPSGTEDVRMEYGGKTTLGWVSSRTRENFGRPYLYFRHEETQKSRDIEHGEDMSETTLQKVRPLMYPVQTWKSGRFDRLGILPFDWLPSPTPTQDIEDVLIASRPVYRSY